MSLKGGPELRARLKALKLAFKPVGRAWAQDTADAMRPLAPKNTGAGAASFRVKNATQRRATVVGRHYMRFQDQGYMLHGPGTKRDRRRTIFAKAVHKRRPGLGFAARASQAALRKHPMAATLIAEWNRAA